MSDSFMWHRTSIGTRLVLMVTGISLVVLVSVILVAYQVGVATLQREARRNLDEHIEAVATSLDSKLDRIRTVVEDVADVVALRSGGQPELLRRMISDILIMSGDLSIERLHVTRPDGNIILFEYRDSEFSGRVVVTRTTHPDESDTPWFFQINPEDTLIWKGPAPGYFADNDLPVFSVATPYGDGEDNFSGVVWIDVPVELFAGHIAYIDNLVGQFPDNAQAYNLLVDDTATVMMVQGIEHHDLAEIEAQLLRDPDLRSAIVGERSPGEEDDFYMLADPLYAGRTAYLRQSLLPSTGWRLISVISGEAMPRFPAESIAQIILIAFLGIVILIWAIRRFIRREVIEPIHRLSRAAREIGNGDMRYRIDYQTRHDEIGRLSHALEDMKTSLAYSYERLRGRGFQLEERIADRTRELEDARHQAQESAAELQTIYDGSLSVVSHQELQPLLEALVSHILSILEGDFCTVWLLQTDGETLKQVAGIAVDTFPPFIKLGEGVAGLVAQDARPVRIDNYNRWDNKLRNSEDWSMERVIGVPLMFIGRPFGVLIVSRGAGAPSFDENDERILTLFANIVSPAVRNAELLAQRDQALETAENANRLKTRFLASVTHELRTPLNLIINQIDFMRIGVFGEVTGEQIRQLDQTIRGAEQLLQLINDLLDASKMEAGEMDVFIQEADPFPVIVDALEVAVAVLDKHEAKGNRIAFSVELPPELPRIPMDARRIRQVLINLLSNAIKYTEEGDVRFAVRLKDDVLEYVVSDTGYGIHESEIPVLFEPFERTTRAKELGIEGTGLGLPISRYLVHKHGGEMVVASEVGVGSTFSFTLPLHSPASESVDSRHQIPQGAQGD